MGIEGSSNSVFRGARVRKSVRFFVTVVLTTGMVATGGFGAFPDNPVTRTVQEEIGRIFPESVLDPVNVYLERISVSTIEPRPSATLNPALDLLGLIVGDVAAESSTPTATIPSATPTPPPTLEPSAPAVTAISISSPTSTATLSPPVTLTPIACSNPTTIPATITFFNGSGQTIEVYLVSPDCRLFLRVTLGPEESFVQETFIGELWWFIDSPTQRLLSDYVVLSANESVDVSTGEILLPTPTALPFLTGTPFGPDS
ncbi:MAG: hypothetical protein IT313_07720 [Anaerolineales bacterium]|nr:hypothetical protein [Anaerolineales bacterium]